VLAAVTYTPGAYRIARALATNQNALEYVHAARARGEGRLYIAVVEILPNMIHPMPRFRGPLRVRSCCSADEFRLGVQPPNAASGSAVRENMPGLAEGAPAVIVPALAIATLTIGMNLFIDSLPLRLRGRAGRSAND
jgi:peptide/nickel transport system permease protein